MIFSENRFPLFRIMRNARTAIRFTVEGGKMTRERQVCGFFTVILLGGAPKIVIVEA
jgi:hypothetical protein